MPQAANDNTPPPRLVPIIGVIVGDGRVILRSEHDLFPNDPREA